MRNPARQKDFPLLMQTQTGLPLTIIVAEIAGCNDSFSLYVASRYAENNLMQVTYS